MGAVAATTDATFDADVINSTTPVVVDFWAPWCGPCRMIAPALDAISAEMGDKVKIVKLNVDDNPQIASKLGIMSIPTLMIFKDGKQIDRKTGAAPQAALRQWIAGHA